MMKLRLERFAQQDRSTLSLIYLDGVFLCFGLEDMMQAIKIAGKTRIPAGTYQIKLRIGSPMSDRYQVQYPITHKGMLWLQDVPGFEYVYIHVGNKPEDTEGCILVGNQCAPPNVLQSRYAYVGLYTSVVQAAERGDLSIEIINKE